MSAFFFFYEGENKLEIEMTLILFLSLGISNKSIPSPRFDKRIMQRALCCQSQNLDMEGESFDWVILVSFLPD